MKILLTEPHPCSYLADQRARTGFIDPDIEVTPALYEALNQLGFRRSGSHHYMPMCDSCRACLPSRIPVQAFRPNRNQRRTIKRNQDLQVRVESAEFRSEAYQLYERYIDARHRDGDMFPASEKQFRGFLVDGSKQCQHIEFRYANELIAVAVTDRLTTGLSAIYTFFDPAHDWRSMGTQAILTQLAIAKRMRLPYLYLGYYIEQSPKMAYKGKFQPLEVMQNGDWHEVISVG